MGSSGESHERAEKGAGLRRWRQRALLWLALIALPHGLLTAPHLRAMGWAFRGAYVAGLLASALAFGLALVALTTSARRWPRVALPVAGAFGFGLGVLVAFMLPYRFRYGEELPVSYLSFAMRYPSYAWTLFRGQTPMALRALMVAVPFVAAHAVVRTTRTEGAGEFFRHARASKRTLGIASFVVLCAASAATSVLHPLAPAPPDVHGLRIALATFEGESDRGHLPKPNRFEVPTRDVPRTRRPNVLVLVGETLSADELAPWNVHGNASSDLGAFFRDHAESMILFADTKSNGCATDISVPSLLTGLAGTASVNDFARAPVLWQEAKAIGYRTGLFSPQTYAWLHFDEFFLSDHPPEVVRTSADYPGEAVNDGGPADERVVESALAFMSAKSDDPFFTVLQFNATHFPYWAPGLAPMTAFSEMVTNDRLGRRPLAVRYVADLVAKLLRTLEGRGLLEDTFVVMTADHGAGSVVVRVARIESHFEDVLHVPMAIHVPASLMREHPEQIAALRENARARTSNTDLFPTLLDLWGLWDGASPPGRPTLAGASLLRPLDPARPLLVMSTGPVRSWRRKGFALYVDRKKWLVDDLEGLALYDLGVDANETKNVASTASKDDRARLVHETADVPGARRLLERVAPSLFR